jgi:hypothetical protein
MRLDVRQRHAFFFRNPRQNLNLLKINFSTSSCEADISLRPKFSLSFQLGCAPTFTPKRFAKRIVSRIILLITRMKSASDIGRCDVGHDGFVIANPFAEVAVEVDFHDEFLLTIDRGPWTMKVRLWSIVCRPLSAFVLHPPSPRENGFYSHLLRIAPARANLRGSHSLFSDSRL